MEPRTFLYSSRFSNEFVTMYQKETKNQLTFIGLESKKKDILKLDGN